MRATALLPGAGTVRADQESPGLMITRRVPLKLARPRPADITIDRRQ
jgi:hypothetical protein